MSVRSRQQEDVVQGNRAPVRVSFVLPQVVARCGMASSFVQIASQAFVLGCAWSLRMKVASRLILRS